MDNKKTGAFIAAKGKEQNITQNALYLCCILAFVCSLLPFLFDMTVVGVFISLCLLAAAIFQAAANRRNINTKTGFVKGIFTNKP